jgi:hypothetical protein
MLHDHLLHAMDHAREVLTKMLDATPREHWRHQPIPGANHVAWTLGHLAWTDDLILRTVAGTAGELPGGEAWDARFAWRTTPAPGPAADAADGHPSDDELRAVFDERRAALRAWFAALPADRFTEAPPKELAGWCPAYGVLPAVVAHHEGMHTGQLQVVRRSLGLAPVFM